eukprot:tig00000246_g21504.t1
MPHVHGASGQRTGGCELARKAKPDVFAIAVVRRSKRLRLLAIAQSKGCRLAARRLQLQLRGLFQIALLAMGARQLGLYVDAAPTRSAQIWGNYWDVNWGWGGDTTFMFCTLGDTAAPVDCRGVKSWATSRVWTSWNAGNTIANARVAYFGWYNSRLSGTEIWNAYASNAVATNRGRYLDYRMDIFDCVFQCGANAVCDRSGNGRHRGASLPDCPPRYSPSLDTGVVLGTNNGAQGPRSLAIPALTFGGNVVLEVWMRPLQVPVQGAVLFDFGNYDPLSASTKSNVDSLIISACTTQCTVASGRFALRVEVFDGSTRVGQVDVFTGSTNGITYIWLEFGPPNAASDSTLKAYRDGLLITTTTIKSIKSVAHTTNFIGKGNEWGRPFFHGIILTELRLWSGTRTDEQVMEHYFNVGPTRSSIHLHYPFNDCAISGSGTRRALDGSGNVNDDAYFACPAGASGMTIPAPTILTASATTSTSVLVSLTWQTGSFIANVEVRCGGLGGPYRAVKAVEDAGAAAGETFILNTVPSYEGSYTLTCTALASTLSDAFSAASASVAVSVPAGGSLPTQSALLPAGNSKVYNVYNRPLIDIDDEDVDRELVYAAPLPSYPLGSRAASTRMALVFRKGRDLVYCDYDLKSSLCTALQRYSGVVSESSQFAFSSMLPFLAVDPDRRFSPHALEAHQGNWIWGATSASKADLLGPTLDSCLQPPAACSDAACHYFAAQRWAAYAFDGSCDPGALGAVRPWPREVCSSSAGDPDPYLFMDIARNFSHDFRLFHALYGQRFYDATSGPKAAAAEGGCAELWAVALGSVSIFTPTTAPDADSSKLSRTEYLSLLDSQGAGDADMDSGLGFESFANGYFAKECTPFYDAEPASVGRSTGGSRAAEDVQGSYGESFEALLLEDVQVFTFSQRGLAFFASYASAGPIASFPLIKACAPQTGVVLLAFDLAAIAPAGFSHNAETVYKRLPWPGEKGSSFADAYLPPASIVELRADGRTEEGGPLRYHALVRLPFFPTSPATCPFELVGASVCPGLDVAHVTAIFSWAVHESSLAERASSADASYSYRSGVAMHGPPKVLRTDTLPLSQHWIVQNERPLMAGRGFGYLECPPQIFRVAKADGYQSGMAGQLNGSVRIYGASTWGGSLAEWTSVAAAAYKDGVLYVVREIHSSATQRSFSFATSDKDKPRPRLIKEKRLQRTNERALSSQLLQVKGVDGPSFDAASVSVAIVLDSWVANIAGAYTVEDYSALDAAAFGLDCPPGTVWNADAAVFKRSVSVKDLCTPLSPGLFSARAGLLIESEAEQCSSGTYSTGGATACLPCPAGTWSAAGSSGCYSCPQNEFALAEGMPCTPCETGAFTVSDRWTRQCFKCLGGLFLKNENDRLFCLNCPANQYSFYGTIDRCSNCSRGSFPNRDGSDCTNCTAGWYQPRENEPCEPCPIGSWSRAGQFGSCFTCPANQLSNDNGGGCKPCPPGLEVKISPKGARACDLCFQDYASPTGLGCSRCPGGYISLPDRLQCLPCPPGTYEDANIPGVCTPCRVNTIAPLQASTNCTACPLGSYSSPDRTMCFDCTPGSYRPANSTICLPVGARSVALVGSSAFSVCGNGSVPNVERSECLKCPKGTSRFDDNCLTCDQNAVASLEGTPICSLCAPGYVSASDFQSCIPCPAARPENGVAMEGSPSFVLCQDGYVANQARDTCLPCSKGYYKFNNTCQKCAQRARYTLNISDDDAANIVHFAQLPREYEDMSRCEPVPHKTVSIPDRSWYQPCEPGWVANNIATMCLPCPKGSYEDDGACRACATNTITPAENMTSCELCPPGYVSAADLQNCVPNVPRREHDRLHARPFRSVALAGSPTWTVCDAGYVADGPRAICIPCPAGSYQVNDSCILCETNWVAATPGLDRCEQCDNGTVAAANGQFCVPCLPGFYRHEGMVECERAPRGAIAAAGSRNYTMCDRGSRPDLEATSCDVCERGTIEVGWECIDCIGLMYAPDRGMTSCKTCESCLEPPWGHFASNDSTRYIPCDAGFFEWLPKNTSRPRKCLQCPLGTYAPKEGTFEHCTNCSLGFYSAPDFRSCLPCPLGSYRDSHFATCQPCPITTAARREGMSPGKVPRKDRAECVDCEGGYMPINGTCVRCDSVSTALPGDPTCTPCPEGFVANDLGTECIACNVSMYRPAGAMSCIKCPRNTISGNGSPGCTQCAGGEVSDETQAFCSPCARGQYRNVSMDYCTPCPPGFMAGENGASACLPCAATQLCPVGTADPVEIPRYQDVIGGIKDLVAGARIVPQRRRVRLLGCAEPTKFSDGRRRGLLQDAIDDFVVETFVDDTVNATITRPEIEDESVAFAQLYRIITYIAAAVGALVLVAAIAICVHLKTGSGDRAAERYRRVAKINVLYSEVVDQTLQENEDLEAALDVLRAGGAVFAIAGLGFFVIAAAFVVLQYAIANYTVLQTLLGGASPSAGSITGVFAVRAAFVGYPGSCIMRGSADPSGFANASDASWVGATASFRGIAPVDDDPNSLPQLSAFYNETQRACIVDWMCQNCTLSAATNVSVELRLASRMALAVAVTYKIEVPTNLTVEGRVRTRSDATLGVFRGLRPVVAPLSLVPLHFEDARDGSPRYDTSLWPSSNRGAEAEEESFSLCSLTLPLSHPSCAGESVAFRAAFELSDVHVRVSRVERASLLDMFADLSALTGSAINIGCQLLLAFVALLQLMQASRSDLLNLSHYYVARPETLQMALVDAKSSRTGSASDVSSEHLSVLAPGHGPSSSPTRATRGAPPRGVGTALALPPADTGASLPTLAQFLDTQGLGEARPAERVGALAPLWVGAANRSAEPPPPDSMPSASPANSALRDAAAALGTALEKQLRPLAAIAARPGTFDPAPRSLAGALARQKALDDSARPSPAADLASVSASRSSIASSAAMAAAGAAPRSAASALGLQLPPAAVHDEVAAGLAELHGPGAPAGAPGPADGEAQALRPAADSTSMAKQAGQQGRAPSPAAQRPADAAASSRSSAVAIASVKASSASPPPSFVGNPTSSPPSDGGGARGPRSAPAAREQPAQSHAQAPPPSASGRNRGSGSGSVAASSLAIESAGSGHAPSSAPASDPRWDRGGSRVGRHAQPEPEGTARAKSSARGGATGLDLGLAVPDGFEEVEAGGALSAKKPHDRYGDFTSI